MSDFYEFLTPIAIVFTIFGLPICAFVIIRIMAHRERMAMIAAGVAEGPLGKAAAPQVQQARNSAYATEPAQVTLNKGIRLAFIGFAITLGLSLASFHSGDGSMSWRPGPWLLFGLVPMFIGIAQVIIGVLAGATLGTRVAQPPVPAPIPPYVPPQQTPPRDWTADPFDLSFNLPAATSESPQQAPHPDV